MSKKYCYWSVADKQNLSMISTAIKSAKEVGIIEDFHIWTNAPKIEGATVHVYDTFNKNKYLSKIKLLKEQVGFLNYDYFVFIDENTYFVRNPGNIIDSVYNDPIHVCLESNCLSKIVKRTDWLGIPLNKFCQLMRERGVRTKYIFNTNSKFWIVKKEAIEVVFSLSLDFWNYGKSKGYTLTEEATLAYVGHMLMGDVYKHTVTSNKNTWANDWANEYKGRIEEDNENFLFEDYISGEKNIINPSFICYSKNKEEKKTEMKRKIILKNYQSPGDILMLTAAVRDLKISHPEIEIDVRTSSMEIWENNPYLTKLDENDTNTEVYDVGYPLIHESNEGPWHFIHGFRLDIENKLGVRIKATKFWGDIHFSKEELSWISMIHEHYTHKDTPFWLICTGGKTDYSAKWWIPEYAQEVVNYFKGKINFVQFGSSAKGHFHPKLEGVIDLVGKTDLRMFMRLAYHSDGIVCPITFAMHLAAALPQKPDKPRHKPCVVTAGGREPCTFTRYTHHGFLHANGYLKCCDNGGCWKSRTVPIGDGDKKDTELCINTVILNGRKVQRCMYDFATPKMVIQEIEKYYIGGMLKYSNE